MEKTKKKEYEALDRIREILKDFDPEDTRIGKAFEGCVEQAEENLRYDGMMSWKAEYESKSREVARLTEKLAEVNKRLRESEVTRVDLTKELNQKDDTIARLTDAKNQLSEKIGRLDGVIAQRDSIRQELLGKLYDAKEEVEDLKLTIVKLKAKLYDMMTGEEVKE
ncbi:MAG: hypothetical protein J6D46_02880 [Lachnospiraceae bacterium]|nr:hypothetical protein [Lachnospiraceae bacterium]